MRNLSIDKTYLIRDNYIKAQFELLCPKMTNIIKNDIINLIKLDYSVLNIEFNYSMGGGNGYFILSNNIGLWKRLN